MPKNNFIRNDDYVDPGVDYSNPIVKKYVHKDYVVITGDTEDDFIIDQKPVLIEEYNSVKQIQKEAKGTDLKSLILQVMQTGDTSPLEVNKGKGSYVDITGYPEDPIEAHNAILNGQIVLENLPQGLKEKSVEELANMTPEQIQEYVKGVINQNITGQATEKAVYDAAAQKEAAKKEGE